MAHAYAAGMAREGDRKGMRAHTGCARRALERRTRTRGGGGTLGGVQGVHGTCMSVWDVLGARGMCKWVAHRWACTSGSRLDARVLLDGVWDVLRCAHEGSSKDGHVCGSRAG